MSRYLKDSLHSCNIISYLLQQIVIISFVICIYNQLMVQIISKPVISETILNYKMLCFYGTFSSHHVQTDINSEK